MCGMFKSAAGSIKALKHECIQEAHDYRLKKKYVDGAYCYYSRRILRESGEVLA